MVQKKEYDSHSLVDTSTVSSCTYVYLVRYAGDLQYQKIQFSAMLRNSRSFIHSHGWIFIYSNIDDGNSWRNDQRAFRKEWVQGSIPRFTRMHTPWSILFPLKIASLNGHFTVSQVDPGNTIGIDIWMDVYIRGHASLYVVYLRMVKGYANLLLPFTPVEWRLWWIDLMWCL